MAFDPLDDRPAPKKAVHEIGQDLSSLSLEEIDECVAALEAEIARLRQARVAKEASAVAASAFFKS